MQITSGKIPSALKVTVYGPEGIGKSTFAAKFPDPVFCDTEGSTRHMDVKRTPKPTSWTMLLEQVKYFIQHPDELGTFVLDTADWAERLCIEQLCAKAQVDGIESFGYGKGYIYLQEEFGRLLDLLTMLIEKGVNVVVTAHAQMRKFEQPDEMGAYDRWELKLSKKVAPMVKEWADALLFTNYKTIVVNVDNQGAAKGKNKAQGGRRVMYTTHHPCWDAKNRFGLPDEMPFEFAGIAHLFEARVKPSEAPANAPPPPTTNPPPTPEEPNTAAAAPPPPPPSSPEPGDEIPQALADLMRANDVNAEELRFAVSEKGYYPVATPISNYDPDFVKGVLIGAWPQVLAMVLKNRANTPF